MASWSPPVELDWQAWVDRWDRMQRRYLVRRSERFDVIVGLVRAVRPAAATAVDLGCGTGSVALALLEAFPAMSVIGVDFDPAILWLAHARLRAFRSRLQLHLVDLRDATWVQRITHPVDAVVSATALHWLAPSELDGLYRQIAQVLRPGGVFLNADHVGSSSQDVQRAWEAHRADMRERESVVGDDWDGFWTAYLKAVELEGARPDQRIVGGRGWEGGVEEGLPLTWHLDRLRSAGFRHVDCFWRCDCDAIYGGIRAQDGTSSSEAARGGT